jgi:hypothetical protein
VRKKFVLSALFALGLVGATFLALGSSGSAEAACPPGDTGCNQQNSLAVDITNASNASSVFFFSPVFFPSPIFTVPVVAPIVTFPVVTPVFVQSPFFFGFPFGSCVRTGDIGFCPSFFSWQLANASGWRQPFFFP